MTPPISRPLIAALRGRAAPPALLALLAAGPLVAFPLDARAAESRVFHLPAEPVERALVRFAVQGGVSVGGLPAPPCGGISRPTYGLMSSTRALGRLLPAGCGFEAIDARSFRVIGVAAPRPRAAPASATPAAPAPDPLDELVVTAERRPEPLIGRAYAISVVAHEDLERLGGRSFADAALQVVGVTVTNLGSGRNKIFVRGLSDGSFTGHTQSTVGLYLDDVPITYSAPDPDLRLVDIDRVEVLRGPQGTLYGSGSIGGIVRIVTAKPDPDAFAGSVSVEAMTTAHGANGTGLDGMLNLPVLGGEGALRLVAYRDERPGYIDNPRLGLADVNYGQRSGVRLAGVLQGPAGWRLEGGYAHQSINTRDSQYAQDAGGRLTRDAQAREPHDNDFSQFSAAATHAGSVADLKISAAFIDHSLDSRYDATGAFGHAGPQAFDESRKVDLSVVEALLSSSSEGRLHWLGGLFASQTTETGAAMLTALQPAAPGLTVYRRRDKLTEAAVYGEAAYDLNRRLTLTIGGRVFATEVISRGDQFGLAPQLPPTHRSRHTSDYTPKFRLSYAWSPDAVVYAQVQEGYRAAGFNILAAADGTSPGSTASRFLPDRLRSYEAGGTLSLFDRSVKLRAAVFHASWKDLQTDQYMASGLPMTVNIGDGTNTGVEVEAVWRPSWRLQVRGNLLIEDPQINRADSAFPVAIDIGLPGVPSHLGSADIRYRWHVAPGWQGEASAQYAYIGHSFLTFDGGAAGLMGGYGVGRVSVAVSSEQLRLSAYVDNVGDGKGDTFAFGNPFSRARSKQSTPLRPRTFGVTASRSF
jgi:iron complex outermembrane receptor protein